MEAMQRPTLHPATDTVRTDAAFAQLTDRDDAALTDGELRDRPIGAYFLKRSRGWETRMRKAVVVA